MPPPICCHPSRGRPRVPRLCMWLGKGRRSTGGGCACPCLAPPPRLTLALRWPGSNAAPVHRIGGPVEHV
eukprot:8163036-Alexandrium_andersonii.AAC.1